METPRDPASAAGGAAAPVAGLPRARLGLLWGGELPEGILVQALRLLPTDCRVRASCVCRAWRDAAADPSLLVDIWFSATTLNTPPWRPSVALGSRDLERLCARAGAALRVVDLDSPYVAACSDSFAPRAVIAALRNGGCTGLRRLTFPDFTADLSNIYHYSLSFRKAQRLKAAFPALEFCDCAVDCANAGDVALMCDFVPGPRLLVMSDPNPRGAMAAAFATRPQVTGLVVRWCLQDAQLLREALQSNNALKTLVLEGCDMDAARVAGLGVALQTNTTLAFLSLAGNRFGEAGAAALCEGLCVNSTLSELWLSSTQLGDAGAAVLSRALRTHATLKTLRLDDNEIADAGATALSQALRANTFKLQTLDLEDNAIGDAGGASLGDALHQNTWLKTLQLNNNVIGDAGAASIGAALRVNATLGTLTIDENPIGDAGEAALARGVRRNVTIAQFWLNDKFIVPGLG